MKRAIFLLMLIIISFTGVSQTTKSPPPKMQLVLPNKGFDNLPVIENLEALQRLLPPTPEMGWVSTSGSDVVQATEKRLDRIDNTKVPTYRPVRRTVAVGFSNKPLNGYSQGYYVPIPQVVIVGNH